MCAEETAIGILMSLPFAFPVSLVDALLHQYLNIVKKFTFVLVVYGNCITGKAIKSISLLETRCNNLSKVY